MSIIAGTIEQVLSCYEVMVQASRAGFPDLWAAFDGHCIDSELSEFLDQPVIPPIVIATTKEPMMFKKWSRKLTIDGYKTDGLIESAIVAPGATVIVRNYASPRHAGPMQAFLPTDWEPLAPFVVTDGMPLADFDRWFEVPA